jgi:hypothetical protein
VTTWPQRASTTLCVAVLLAAPAAAQQNPPLPTDPICPAGAAPQVDADVFTVVAASATHWNRHEYTAEEKARILFHADAIRQRFVQPPALGDVPLVAESNIAAWGGAPIRHSAVGGKLVLVMKSNGRLRTSFWQLLPFSHPFAIALSNAVATADAAKDFEGIPAVPGTRGDDTLVVQIYTTSNPPEAHELPLMRAELRTYIPEQRLSIKKRGGLYYPDGAAYSGVENKGEMQVLVGSDGKPIMTSAQVTRIEWRDFLSTMRRAIEGTVFEPARSGGCAVPSLTVQSFNFSIDRDRS